MWGFLPLVSLCLLSTTSADKCLLWKFYLEFLADHRIPGSKGFSGVFLYLPVKINQTELIVPTSSWCRVARERGKGLYAHRQEGVCKSYGKSLAKCESRGEAVFSSASRLPFMNNRVAISACFTCPPPKFTLNLNELQKREVECNWNCWVYN